MNTLPSDSRPPERPAQEPSGEEAAELAARLVVMRLSGVGPRRAQWLIGPSARAAVEALRAGQLPEALGPAPPGVQGAMVETWLAEVRRVDGLEELDRHRSAGVHVLGPDHPCWPFADDPDPPVLLFSSRPLDQLVGSPPPRIGIVGTRRCSTVGRRVAQSLGTDLTRAGVAVVSGLALGIDGSAHLGALSGLEGAGGLEVAASAAAGASPPSAALPIAVVATGLDRVYPPANRELWSQLLQRGIILSEAPLGTAPERWRFPARNRLIAALSSLVVVVESHATGGALLTVDEAAERGVPVAAVPGSVLSVASAGSNALLVDGCPPVRNAQDLLDLIGHDLIGHFGPASLPSSSSPAPAVGGSLEQRILAQLGAGELHLDQLVVEVGVPLRAVVRAVAVLVDQGLARRIGNRVSVSDS